MLVQVSCLLVQVAPVIDFIDCIDFIYSPFYCLLAVFYLGVAIKLI